VTADEAARALGLSVDAVRKRVQRGTIAHEKDQAGRVRIILDDAETLQDTPQDTTRQPRPDHTAELIATLREQLQAERQAHAEARRIIAGLVERIPAIDAPRGEESSPSEATESPSEATPQPGRVGPQPAASKSTQAQESHEMHMPEVHGGPLPRDQQEASERPWWRRMFGG
jgi:hypothetical protein